jgi:hypothetical protein
MTKKELYDLAKLNLRSVVQDNFINNITDDDLDLAVIQTVSAINSSKPMSSFVLDDLLNVKGDVWSNTLIAGITGYTIMHQVSEWMHNGVDVSIDAFSIQDKMDAYKGIADFWLQEFKDSVSIMKSQVYYTNLKSVRVNRSRSTGNFSTSRMQCFNKAIKYR